MPSTRSQALARKTTFPFLDLAGETRNAIYRALLDDITQPTHAFSVWREDVPAYPKLAAYAALLRVCKAVNFEFRSIFEKEHLSKMHIYFSDLRTLYESADSDGATGFKQTGRYASFGEFQSVSLPELPRMVWVVIEKLLVDGSAEQPDEEFRSLLKGTEITAKQSDDRRYDVACTVDIPAVPALATHPKLAVCSRFQAGHFSVFTGTRQTAATIERKIADFGKVQDWREEDQDGLELNMRDWEAVVVEGPVGRRTCFDVLWQAQDRLRMSSGEGQVVTVQIKVDREQAHGETCWNT